MKVRVTFEFEVEASTIEYKIAEILLINHLLTTKRWSHLKDKYEKWRISRARVIKCIRKSYEWDQIGSPSWTGSISGSEKDKEIYHIDRWKSEAKELSKKLFPELY